MKKKCRIISQISRNRNNAVAVCGRRSTRTDETDQDKEVKTMTIMEFRCQILKNAVSTAEILAEISTAENIKKEPEQVRKNIATILSILHETEDYLAELDKNICSDSNIV